MRRSNSKIIYLFFFFILAIFTNSFGQLYNFRHYNPENGFPQANADAIVQDSSGYLWFATQVGAVRFDGKNYYILDETKGLANNLVVRLFIDNKNQLWIGTRNGLSLYTRDSVFSFYENDGLPSNLINNIWQSNDGSIWVSTSKGIVYLEQSQFKKTSHIPDNLRISDVLNIKNNIYLSSNYGIYEQQNKKITRCVFDTLRNVNVVSLAWNKKNTIWIVTKTGELQEYSLTTKKLNLINPSKNKRFNNYTDLCFDSRNLLWIGTEGNGLICYDGINFNFFSKDNGLHNISVLKILEDTEGNLWIGGRNGVTFFNPVNPFEHYPEANNNSKIGVFGMGQDAENNIWFTTYGNGVSVLKNGQFHYFNEKHGLPDNRFFSVICDSKNNLWFSTAGKGIVKYNGANFTIYDKKNGYLDTRVFKVFEDRDGNIWCCSQFDGIAKFDGSKFIKFTKNDGLSGNTIMSAAEDNFGNIWFGSFGNGITKYENGKFIDYSKKYKIKPQNIRSIACDKNGKIWFGSSNSGVFRIDTIINDTAICYFIDKNKGLNSDNIYFIYSDSRNWLWVGTELGVTKIILDSNSCFSRIKNYGKSEGFIGGETSINGVLEDNEGRIWFGSTLGATVFDWQKETENAVLPKTSIVNVKLFFKEQDWKKSKYNADYRGLPKNLILPYNQNHLSFEYIGISLTNPEKVRYKFYLEGLDNSWSPETDKTEAIYSHIPPGSYTFKVLACNNDGYWNAYPATFSFTINLPFWKTIWFILMLIISVCAIGFIIIRLRIKNLKETKKILELTVKERTAQLELNQKEIQDKNFELQAINFELNSQKAEIEAQRDMVLQQKEHIEKIHGQLTESIYYAKRIQNALQPSDETLSLYFKNSFVFYKPLQIVSGDFYWVTIINQKIYFAVADCTGHGVPGAMMSMLGIAFLNDIVNKAEYKPNEILFQLRDYLIRALHQTGKNSDDYRDGMDIALCCYHPQAKILEYAGANISLYLITKKMEDGDKNRESNIQVHLNCNDISFVEIKTPKIPLAIYENAENIINVSIPIHAEDVLYMFTDGFADQFGGPQNKKYSYPQFRQLLFDIHMQENHIQKNIIWKTFKEWRGRNEQIDDVLVMGIKF